GRRRCLPARRRPGPLRGDRDSLMEGALRTAWSAAAAPRERGWNVPAAGDPRWAFAALLGLYAVVGCQFLGFNRSLGQVAMTVGASCALDVFLASRLRGRRIFPLSACITGLSLSLLLNYAHGSAIFLLPVYLAIGSKYVF